MNKRALSFMRRYGIGLAIEIVLALIEWFVDFLPFASIQAKSFILSGIASTWVLYETWRETPRGERPPLLQTIVLWWPSGALTLWIFFGLIAAITKRPPSITPVNVNIKEPTPIVLVVTPTPGVTSSKMLQSTPTSITSPTPIIIVVTPTPSPTPTVPVGFKKVCAEAPPSPFDVGRRGYICNDERVLLWEKASVRSRVIASLPPSVKFEIIGGPECGYQRVWWKIRLSGNESSFFNGLVGWIPETSPAGEEVFICPLP